MQNSNTTIRVVEGNSPNYLETNIQRTVNRIEYITAQIKILLQAAQVLKEEGELAVKELNALSIVHGIKVGKFDISARDGRNLNISFS